MGRVRTGDDEGDLARRTGRASCSTGLLDVPVRALAGRACSSSVKAEVECTSDPTARGTGTAMGEMGAEGWIAGSDGGASVALDGEETGDGVPNLTLDDGGNVDVRSSAIMART